MISSPHVASLQQPRSLADASLDMHARARVTFVFAVSWSRIGRKHTRYQPLHAAAQSHDAS